MIDRKIATEARKITESVRVLQCLSRQDWELMSCYGGLD